MRALLVRAIAGSAVTLVLVAGLTTTTPAPAPALTSTTPAPAVPPAAGLATATGRAVPVPPALDVKVLRDHYRLPWDVRELPDGSLIVSERSPGRVSVLTGGAHRKKRKVSFNSARVWSAEETGLMGLAVDPNFAENRRVYTCMGGITLTGFDVRVVAWKLEKLKMRKPEVLLAGIPVSNGGHGGCRLLIDERSGALLATTGDGRILGNAHSIDTLGGKVLRLNRFNGSPWPRNRWFAEGGNRAYVLTYGHRNPQGIAQRRDGTLWSAEHGTYRDDEVNLLQNGGDYGWDPQGPLYDDAPPMTNYFLPGLQREPRWTSGNPTIAPSGIAFVYGRQWGSLDGAMAVAVLKSRQLLFLKFDATRRLTWAVAPLELTAYGRLRSVFQRRNGDLIVATSNGGNDKILRVRPARS